MRSPVPTPDVDLSPIPSAGPSGAITIHVAGAVVAPGLVEVRSDARVADAIAAAGGAESHADLKGLNLAAPLRDGDQIQVPSWGEALDPGRRQASESVGVRINVASIEELQGLPGVGPVLAARIAEYREQSGAFTVVEDLLDVPGIGEAKLATMRDAVVLP